MSRRTHRRIATLGVVIVSLFTVGVAHAAWKVQATAKAKVKLAKMGVTVNGEQDGTLNLSGGTTARPTCTNNGCTVNMDTYEPLLPGEYVSYDFVARNTGNVSERFEATSGSTNDCLVGSVQNFNGEGYSEYNQDGTTTDRDLDFDPDQWTRGTFVVQVDEREECASRGGEGEVWVKVTATLSPSPRD